MQNTHANFCQFPSLLQHCDLLVCRLNCGIPSRENITGLQHQGTEINCQDRNILLLQGNHGGEGKANFRREGKLQG